MSEMIEQMSPPMVNYQGAAGTNQEPQWNPTCLEEIQNRWGYYYIWESGDINPDGNWI